jgi:polar amino acid transport system substrate-binding protein
MTATKERAEVLDFVNEYYAGPAIITVNADNDAIKSAADLTGKKVGFEAGSTYEKYLQKSLVFPPPSTAKVEYPFGELRPVPYDSEDTAFQDLGLGTGKRLDAVISSYITAKPRVEKSDGKLKNVGEVLFAEPIWVAADKGDPEWQAKIKSIFKAMSGDGTLKVISEKWIGSDISTRQ